MSKIVTYILSSAIIFGIIMAIFTYFTTFENSQYYQNRPDELLWLAYIWLSSVTFSFAIIAVIVQLIFLIKNKLNKSLKNHENKMIKISIYIISAGFLFGLIAAISVGFIALEHNPQNIYTDNPRTLAILLYNCASSVAFPFIFITVIIRLISCYKYPIQK